MTRPTVVRGGHVLTMGPAGRFSAPGGQQCLKCSAYASEVPLASP
jgi:hypothetical protein